MNPTGRVLVYRNDGDQPCVAAVTSLGALGAVMRLHDWPRTGLYVAREGVPLSVASIEALAERLEALVRR